MRASGSFHRRWAAGLALALLLSLSREAIASDACDRCDLDAIWDEYLAAAKSSQQKAEAAAELLGDAASEYEAALDKAKDLAEGLVGLPDPTDPLAWCGKVGDVVGKFQDAMNVLSAFGNLWQGSANEAKAKELIDSSNWYWKEAQRSRDCWNRCCQALRDKPKVVTVNPDTDLLKAGHDASRIRECLEKLSADDLKKLRSDADAGRLAKHLRPEYVEMIKRMAQSDGRLAAE